MTIWFLEILSIVIIAKMAISICFCCWLMWVCIKLFHWSKVEVVALSFQRASLELLGSPEKVQRLKHLEGISDRSHNTKLSTFKFCDNYMCDYNRTDTFGILIPMLYLCSYLCRFFINFRRKEGISNWFFFLIVPKNVTI